MNRTQFIENIELLFVEFEKSKEYIKKDDLDNYYISNQKSFKLVIYEDNFRFDIFTTVQTYCIYESSEFESYEQLYDELIIFKELILPKFQ